MSHTDTMFRRYANYMENPHTNYRRPMPFTSYSNYDSRAFTWADEKPASTKIYGQSLERLTRDNKRSLEFLADVIAEDNVPCDKYGLKHYHPEHRPHSAPTQRGKETLISSPKWQNKSVIFGGLTGTELEGIEDVSPRWSPRSSCGSEESFESSLTGAFNKFCYLCSTLDEHKKHMMQYRRMKPKEEPKPRIDFIAPLPRNRKKKKEYEEGPPEVLYRLKVKTGIHKDKKTGKIRRDTGTDANVEIILKGDTTSTAKRKLHKNTGSLNHFYFGPNTEEVFYLKAPDLGNLKYLQVEHDGIEKSHSWFLESIKVTNMSTKHSWLFKCDKWLSMYEGDYMLRRILKAEKSEVEGKGKKEYHITVITGKKHFAGTDSNVYLTLFGRGIQSSRLWLHDPNKDCFERKQTDTFLIKAEDVGEIKAIRVEHDGSGLAAGWLLQEVKIRDIPGEIEYIFPCDTWLSEDDGYKLWVELFPQSVKSIGRPKTAGSGKVTGKGETRRIDRPVVSKNMYQVFVTTADKFQAGTDANVFIQFVGRGIRTPQIPLDKSDKRNPFEKGQTDFFQFEAKNVGIIKKVIIGHDGKGIGAGWLLDKIVVKKMLTDEEIKGRMKRVKLAEKEREEEEELWDRSNRRRRKGDKYASSEKEDSEEEEDSEDELAIARKRSERERRNKKEKKKEKKKSGRLMSGSETESDTDSEDDKKKTGKKETIKKEQREKEQKSKSLFSRFTGMFESESESESEKEVSKKSKQKDKQKKVSEDSDSEDEKKGSKQKEKQKYDARQSKFEQTGKEVYCDEYLFESGEWLAEDEGDRKLVRDLKPTRRTPLFR